MYSASEAWEVSNRGVNLDSLNEHEHDALLTLFNTFDNVDVSSLSENDLTARLHELHCHGANALAGGLEPPLEEREEEEDVNELSEGEEEQGEEQEKVMVAEDQEDAPQGEDEATTQEGHISAVAAKETNTLSSSNQADDAMSAIEQKGVAEEYAIRQSEGGSMTELQDASVESETLNVAEHKGLASDHHVPGGQTESGETS
mmetsp:Transcript_13057/g.41696  ORF Transcript_13057/g.41696 Transcript_13057/m.41696 type:complete len:202 (-) Transcript_13057:170-775(-)